MSNCPRLLYAQHVEGAGKDLCGNLPTAPRKNCRQIGHLRSLRAPGLAPDLEQIADKYAEKKRQLEEKVKALDGESEPGAAAQVKAFTHYKLGYAHANVEAIRLLEKSAQMAWIVGVSEIEVQINDGIRRPIGETRTALGSAGNPPSVAEWWKKGKQEETRSDPEPDPDPDF